jgi:hypothetical protein
MTKELPKWECLGNHGWNLDARDARYACIHRRVSGQWLCEMNLAGWDNYGMGQINVDWFITAEEVTEELRNEIRDMVIAYHPDFKEE